MCCHKLPRLIIISLHVQLKQQLHRLGTGHIGDLVRHRPIHTLSRTLPFCQKTSSIRAASTVSLACLVGLLCSSAQRLCVCEELGSFLFFDVICQELLHCLFSGCLWQSTNVDTAPLMFSNCCQHGLLRIHIW